MATTRTRLYQFIGTGKITFKQMFSQYNENPFLFNESCKYFPQVMRKRAEIQYIDLDILYTKKTPIKLSNLAGKQKLDSVLEPMKTIIYYQVN